MVSRHNKQILMVASRSPYPLTAGYRLRIHYLAKILSKGYDVDLLCLQPVKSEDSHPFRNVFIFPISKVQLGFQAIFNWFKRWPLQVGGYFSSKINKWIKENAKRYDVVYVHHVRMAPYAAEVEGFRILDYHDAISMHYREGKKYAKGFWKLFYILEQDRLLHYELEMLNRFDKAFITSSVDREYLLKNLRERNYNAHCPLVVIPMGVKEEVLKRLPNTKPEENQIVFLGKMNYHPNEDAAVYFAKDVFPLIKEKVKDVEFIVVGAYPTRAVLKLERIKGVKVTGFVEDPYEYLEKAKVVVAQMRLGAGIQNKILEAMALRKVVVTTPLGARGIEGENGKHFIVANGQEEMAEKIVELLKDGEKRRWIGDNARALIEEKYTWNVIGEKLLKEIEEII